MDKVMRVGQQCGSERLQCAADRPAQYCNFTDDTIQFTHKLHKTINTQNRTDSVWTRRAVSWNTQSRFTDSRFRDSDDSRRQFVLPDGQKCLFNDAGNY